MYWGNIYKYKIKPLLEKYKELNVSEISIILYVLMYCVLKIVLYTCKKMLCMFCFFFIVNIFKIHIVTKKLMRLGYPYLMIQN